MHYNNKKHVVSAAVAAVMALTPATLCAQADGQRKASVSGSIQSDVLIPQSDEKIGAEKPSEWGLTNTFAEVNMTSEYVDAGARMEYLDHPLPGFEPDYKGWGLPYGYVKAHLKDKVELTLGNYYEQFGSGFILRTYEERALGIDNSLLGARLVVRPAAGVTLKALTGKQRRYWDWNDSQIYGGDVELSLDQWFKGLADGGTYVTLGGSVISKHERATTEKADPTHVLNIPENVMAYDVRARLQHGGWNILAEYARKSQDPSQINHNIYRKGYVAMLSSSYSQRGLSVLLQAKRSDNMSFRSSRNLPSYIENSSFINHLPAFTMEHTYALAAHYPYATNPDGEWAYQAELGYTFKRHTLLGGKYGTKLKFNFSHVHSIDKNVYTPDTYHNGYGSAFWKWGDEKFYQDLNVQIEKKLSSGVKLNLMYMNQYYNKTAIEGEGGMIHSNIFVGEGKFSLGRKATLRCEAQYLTTGEDLGDWAFALAELSLLPNWMITVSDEYNVGATELHYYNAYLTYTAGAHRLQLGYVRTRSGFNCSGGVCRWIPASKGVTMSYNYNF